MPDLIERKAVIAAIADELFIDDSTKAAFRNIVNRVPTINPESLVRHEDMLSKLDKHNHRITSDQPEENG